MTIMANLSGTRITEARLTIPAWGCSFHDVALDAEVTLTGLQTLTVADLTIKCTVLSGGPANGRSFYRLVSGAGGWGKTLPRFEYVNDMGVKLAKVLGDAAAAVGETLDISSVQTARVGRAPGSPSTSGLAFVRPEGPACRLLEQFAPGAWYVGEDGKTRLGARPASTLPAKVTATSIVNLARGTVTLASDTIAGILPGLVYEGHEVVDVEHTIDAEGGLRSKLWFRQGAGTSRRLSALRAMFDQLDPGRKFRGVYEYRVVTQEGSGRLNLQPVYTSNGMPELRHVLVRPGIPGAKAEYPLGSRVLVGFVDSDPARPVVLAFEDAEGPAFVPISLSLAGGGAPVARQGDAVVVYFPPSMAFTGVISGPTITGTITVATPAQGIIQTGSAKVTSG